MTSSRSIIFAAIFLPLIYGASAQSNPQQSDATESFSHQQDFIAKFSGATPYENGNTLAARSSRREREIAANILVSELEAIGLAAERQDYRMPNIHFVLDLLAPPMRGTNIVAQLPATAETASHVIVGAHFDSAPGSPGANDNATGVYTVLATAKAISQLNNRYHHYIFVFFDQEEDNEIGSHAFVQKLVRDGTDVHSMHNADLVGWDGDGDRIFEIDAQTPELRKLYQDSADSLGVALSFVRYNSSDHIVFRNEGFDAVCLSEEWVGGDSTPHHHEPTDSIENVDAEFIALGAALMTEAMTRLAQEPVR